MKSNMRSACPFAEHCEKRDLVEHICETTRPCSTYFTRCHIYEEKMVAFREAKKNSHSSVPQVLANAS